MSTTPPENYVYGTVVGRFLATVVDSADADRFPDVVPATGTVTFTPNATYYKNTAIPATFVTVPQVGHLDAAGYLVDERNATGVVLMATDHPDLSPSGWTYRVTMVINGRQFSPFDITVPAGGTVDLTTVMPAATSAGAITIVSESSRIAAEAAAATAVAAAESIGVDVDAAVENYFLLHPLPENGLPDGGTAGQALVKASSADGDGTWSTLTAADVSAVPTTRTVAGKPLSSNVTLTAADVSAVPTTRTVAGKPLSADVTLTASDVSAVPTTRTVAGKPLSADITLTAADVSAVPTTRTVAGKPLSADISLAKADVGLSNVDDVKQLPVDLSRPIVKALSTTTWQTRASVIPVGFTGNVLYDGSGFTTVTDPTDRIAGDWLVRRRA
jgi:hypothetical protein